jgi:hypothetical protein
MQSPSYASNVRGASSSKATRSTCVASHSAATSPKLSRVGAMRGVERRMDATNSSRRRRASILPTGPRLFQTAERLPGGVAQA